MDGNPAKNNGKIEVYDSQQPNSRRSFPCAADAIESLAVGSSGNFLLVGDTGGNVFRFDLKPDGEPTNLVRFEAHIGASVASAIAASGEFAVTGSWDQSARYWDLSSSTGKSPLFLTLSGHGNRVTSVSISADGKWIATATDSGKILLWDVARCRLILHVTGGDLPHTKGPLETRRSRPLRQATWRWTELARRASQGSNAVFARSISRRRHEACRR